MRLVPCRDCGADVSAQAWTCPRCGCPAPARAGRERSPNREWRLVFRWLGFYLLLGIVLLVLPGGGGLAQQMLFVGAFASAVGLVLLQRWVPVDLSATRPLPYVREAGPVRVGVCLFLGMTASLLFLVLWNR